MLIGKTNKINKYFYRISIDEDIQETTDIKV
ncbi:MAG: hypothetical protein MAG551_00209 [Candidatus Scalindua arabica]|uniref:Uncharacterized protein n=1 Tax=Candidatus Scalindua arabica TaxID=1127984 RepID=A0A941ZXP2_9BACT|nr:hypothetical protein [Candidatus Scalindua arabica]